MSKTQTLSVPDIASLSASISPATLARASTTPMRLLAKNVGGNTLFVGMSAQAVSDQTSTVDAWTLVPGESQVYVLEVGDQMYAAAVGAGGAISIHLSPAFPLGSWGGS